MKTPTQEQFQVVIDTLEKINTGSNEVDMGETDANYCGSPMCHAGWYAFGKFGKMGDGYVSYEVGSLAIAEDLGFISEDELCEWANVNSNLWGNTSGRFMFSSECSFLDGCTNITHLSQIIDHWKGVKQRAAELTKQN